MSHADNLSYFRSRQAAFVSIVAEWRDRPGMNRALLDDAFSDFEDVLAERLKRAQRVACDRGCATCCTIRVTATAPEVLNIAAHLREADPEVCGRLVWRIAEADFETRDADESGRVALRRACPFIDDDGACVIYPVRPLACRGHASHDRQACDRAACGEIAAIPYSIEHRTVRSLVQNALQSALRDHGLPWASYELNHALMLALADPELEQAWRQGLDVFADAQVDDVSPAEMASAFDMLKRARTASCDSGQ